MMLARWQIDAKFGHKQKVIQSVKNWFAEIGEQVGWSKDDVRIITGSIGARESTVISEVPIEDLAELNEAFEQLGDIDAHAQWSKNLEPSIVSGSHRWEIFRVV